MDRAVAQQGWKVVALTRLSPVFPFNVQNYFYGLTAVRFWPYTVTSACTMLPGTLLYVYIGVAGAGVAAALTGAASWGRTALQIAGLLATLLVVVLITRIARKELERATRGGKTTSRATPPRPTPCRVAERRLRWCSGPDRTPVPLASPAAASV